MVKGFSFGSFGVGLQRLGHAEPMEKSLFESASFVEKLVAAEEEFGFF